MKRNVVFILTDQHRLDAAGPLARGFESPAMDSLFHDGVCFTQCFTNSPQCIPARAALMSGKYPFETGIVSNANRPVPDARENWFNQFRKAGYHTAAFGKTHLYPSNGDLVEGQEVLRKLGFETIDETAGPRENAHTRSHLTDHWKALGLLEPYQRDIEARDKGTTPRVSPSPLPFKEYYDVYVAAQARHFLETYDDERPFFCWISFPGPHEPYDAPEPYASMFAPEQMPAPVPRPEDLGGGAPGLLHKLLSHHSPRNPGLSRDEIARLRANYAGSVRLIDDQIAKIIATLKARGLYEDTTILFTSDHGEMNGDWNLLRKGHFLDPSVRVPLIVKPAAPRDSQVSGARYSDALIELFDVGPTLLDLAGVPPLKETQAKSFAPVVRGERARHRSQVVSQFQKEQMFVNDKWKLISNAQGLPSFLFDRRNDPDEQTNCL